VKILIECKAKKLFGARHVQHERSTTQAREQYVNDDK